MISPEIIENSIPQAMEYIRSAPREDIEERLREIGVDLTLSEEDLEEYRHILRLSPGRYLPTMFTPDLTRLPSTTTTTTTTELRNESDTETEPEERVQRISSDDIEELPRGGASPVRASGIRLVIGPNSHRRSIRHSLESMIPVSSPATNSNMLEFVEMPDIPGYTRVIPYEVPPEITNEFRESSITRHPFFLFYPIMMNPEYRETFRNLEIHYRTACDKSIELVSQFRDLGYYMEFSALSLPLEALTPRNLSTANSRNRFYGNWIHVFFENWTLQLRSIRGIERDTIYEHNQELIEFVNERVREGGIHDRILSSFREIYRREWYRSVENMEIEYRPLIYIIKFTYILFIEMYDKLMNELSPENLNTISIHLIIQMVRARMLPADSFSWAVGL
jgi:hypothetical protein